MQRKTPVPPKTDDTKDGLPKHDGHALAGATTIGGAMTGAMVGAIAGPAGAIAGGIIGSAIGALSGAVMEREEHRREVHDRDLDDDIGVTSGAIGVPDEMKHPSVPPPEPAEDDDEQTPKLERK